MGGGGASNASGEQTEAVSASADASAAAGESVAADAAASTEQVLLDNDIVKVTLGDKVEDSNYIGYSALIENKSDQYILLGIDASSVDGLMTDFNVQGGSVAPGKKSKAEFRVYTSNSDVKSLDDLKNVEGIFTISTNTDGGNSYTRLKDTYPFTISDEAGAAQAAAGNEAAAEGDGKQTDYAKIEGIYVDNSYTSKDDGNKKLVYVFFDAFTNAENLQVSSKASTLTVNDTNSYESSKLMGKAIPMESYYYSSYIKDVYVGESQKVVLTFIIPAAELEAGRTITMDLYGIPDTDKIKLSTDEIVACNSEDEIAQQADPEGYASYQTKIQPADAETTEKVKQAINGYTFSFSYSVGNSTINQGMAFEAPDKFEMQLGGTRVNGGTYVVENGFLACTYDGQVDVNGNKVSDEKKTVLVPWSWGADDIELDLSGFAAVS